MIISLLSFSLCLVFIVARTLNIFILLTNFKSIMSYCWLYICNVIKHIYRAYLSYILATICLLINNSPLLPSVNPGNHHSNIWFYEQLYSLDHHDISAFGDSETNWGPCQLFKGMILEINCTDKLLCNEI